MSSILLLGSSGLVGRAILKCAPSHWHVTRPSSKECDITNEKSVSSFLDKAKPSLLINCAAFTNVDASEDQFEQAQKTNALGPQLLATECKKNNIRLIHFSSDYVFDGSSTTPYKEDAKTNPLSRYGQSKLDGERAVLDSSPNNLVIRSQWIFGEGAHSLVATMTARAKRNEPARVVNDQHGRPTYAMDLAATIVAVAERADVTGVLHIANDGEATPFEIAREVYAHFGRSELVTAVRSEEFAAKARRPRYSVLALDRLRALGIAPRHWTVALTEYLKSGNA